MPNTHASSSSRSKKKHRPHYNTTPEGSSPFTMWVGNIPSNATEEEASAFFDTLVAPTVDTTSSSSAYTTSSGVVSIFILPQSHCAFVNYTDDEHLQRAIEFFHNRLFRPDGLKIKCRVRNSELTRSGVVLQRERGVHRNWVKNRSIVHPRNDASSDHDSASTTSSTLAHHFPIRYFILKALTHDDLQRSMQSGYWSTQKHNEDVLNRAYRTSEDVYLIYSANRSGEFVGYARMASLISINNPEAALSSLTDQFASYDLSTVSSYSKTGHNSTHSQLSGHLLSPALSEPPSASTSFSYRTDGELNQESQSSQQRGMPFKVQWIQTRSVPFHQIRAMRNPWNNNRALKISRDGTEIEPATGKALLEQWGPLPEALNKS